MRQAVANGTQGNCDYYGRFHNEWITSQAGFLDVPAEWYGRYYEYRVLLQQAIDVTKPIYDACAAGGGTISTEIDLAIIAVMDNGVQRTASILEGNPNP